MNSNEPFRCRDCGIKYNCGEEQAEVDMTSNSDTSLCKWCANEISDTHEEQLAKAYDAIDKLISDTRATRKLVAPLLDNAYQNNEVALLKDFTHIRLTLADMMIELEQLKKLWIWLK